MLGVYIVGVISGAVAAIGAAYIIGKTDREEMRNGQD